MIENMKSVECLIKLSRLFIQDKSLEKEINLAMEKPENYVNKFSSQSKKYVVDVHSSKLPWLALIDGLYQRKLLQELDWKADQETLIFTALELLKSHSNYTEIATNFRQIVPFIDENIEEFLAQLNRKLCSFNVQLVWLDTNSDSYPISFLDKKDVAQAKKLIAQLNYGGLYV